MDTQTFIHKLFERASQEGFTAYEAYYATGSQFEVSVFGGEIIDYNVSGSLGLSFRALLNGKMGYASTQVLDEDALQLLIDGARTNALLIENEDEQFIFEGSPAYPEIETFNPEIDRMSAAQKIEMALTLEKTALSMDERVKQVEYCALMSMAGERRIVNSRGVDLRFCDNGFGFGLVASAREGDKASTAGKFVFSRNPEELCIEDVAAFVVREATDGLSAQPVPSGNYRVALRNDAAAALLSTFASVFSADMAQRGLSLLKGREGSAIASEAVTLIDDPLSMDALSTTPFDAEGVATQRRLIIEAGVLTTLMHNLKTAKKQGVQTTGNASKGSYSAPVGVAPTNFYLQPSNLSMDDLLRELGNGLLITELNGLHSGANTISGDFSLSAKGYRVEGGKPGSSVNQITVAGNFYALLKDVVAVAGDLEFGMPGTSCVGSPTMLLGKLAVAG